MTSLDVIRSRVTIDGNGCWVHRSQGRARIRHEGRDQYAYRVAWQLVNGPIPEGMLACHTCDEPRCCNPDHLFLGTVKDNAQDMITKHRFHPETWARKGMAHPRVTVTDDLVEQARAEYAAGRVSQASLAARLGVGQSTIGRWMRADVRTDAPVLKAQPIPEHGTRAGYFHHRRKSLTQPCPACLEAHRIYMRAYKALRRTQVAA